MNAPVPCRIQGKEFRSLSDAAKHFGVTTSAVWHAIENGTEDTLGKGNGMQRPCIVDGTYYASRKEGAVAADMSKELMRAICRELERTGDLFATYNEHKIEVPK